MKLKNLRFTVFLLLVGTQFCGTSLAQTTFNYTGSVQTYTVPAGVTTITVDVRGASGGVPYKNGVSFPAGAGKGGRVVATVSVTPGEVLNIYVGGKGNDGTSSTTAGNGGFNGGGNGSDAYNVGAGGGGGASDIRRGGTGLSNRIVVAGGGGGANDYNVSTGSGGDGGGLVGASGNVNGVSRAATGGTQSAGGIGGLFSGYTKGGDGSLGVGGNGGSGNVGGGGGGGYYGGGGGSFSSGAGGSSYTLSTATNVTHTQGYNAGDGIVIISTNLLPVTLVSFTATPSQGNVLVAWTTANEINNDYFLVESSTNTIDWTSKGKIAGGKSSYSFVDSLPSKGESFYRLKQVDKDGKYTLSDVRSVVLSADNKKLSIYPNPVVNNQLSVTINNTVTDKLAFVIMLTNGKVVSTGFINSRSNNISVANLPVGTYIIKLASGETATFIKQ
ncbi:glycine-rich protein [Parasediminibacterium paludis]|uniref:receptor protein-tyrosine kinase n=1 Tax=Parasediminibacterium paludis TaxID=908966 RepID=A0ABV8Q069_9BACT